MIKKLLILYLLTFSVLSCAGIAGGLIAGANSKGSRATIFGRQTYKYKCVKVGDCCEIGKNCEEDLKKE